MVAPFLSFWGNSTLFSLVFVLVYIAMSHAHELPSLSILTSCYPCLLDHSHSDICEGIVHCDSDCISLMTIYAEHLFMDLLDIWTSSLEKVSIRSFAHFKIGISAFLLLSCKSSLLFNINLLSDMWFTNIFFHSVGYLFILLFSLLYYRSFSVWCSLPF